MLPRSDAKISRIFSKSEKSGERENTGTHLRTQLTNSNIVFFLCQYKRTILIR